MTFMIARGIMPLICQALISHDHQDESAAGGEGGRGAHMSKLRGLAVQALKIRWAAAA